MLGVLAGVAAFIAFMVVIGVVVWLIRMMVTSRRWNKLSKVQYDVHSKLLDRFTTNEDLLAYMQTPGGRRFLEAAPLRLPDEPRSMSAPLTRILWSIQAGIVLVVTGIGLLLRQREFHRRGAGQVLHGHWRDYARPRRRLHRFSRRGVWRVAKARAAGSGSRRQCVM